jgi:hypothetical protein
MVDTPPNDAGRIAESCLKLASQSSDPAVRLALFMLAQRSLEMEARYKSHLDIICNGAVRGPLY